LDKLQNTSGLQVTNSRKKIKFESSLNFRGVQIFLEKYDKLYKIPSSHDLHKNEFSWVHLYVRF
jgi:hypothetical protein